VDVSPAIFGYKIYRPLRDERAFSTGVIAEDGDAVSWGNDDLMMSADAIQSLAQESWCPVEFADFLRRMNLTQESAAALLGRSRRQIATYATKGPIPRVVTLACYGFESLRRDRFLTGAISQPPAVRASPAPAEPPRSPITPQGSGNALSREQQELQIQCSLDTSRFGAISQLVNGSEPTVEGSE
jgi:hypothetical protein